MRWPDPTAQEPFVATLAEDRFTIDEGPRKKRESSPFTWLVAGTIWGALLAVLFVTYVQPTLASNTGPFAPRSVNIFTLPNLDGETVKFDGEGRHLLILSAVGCQDCRERVPIDRTLAKLANLKGVSVTNLLVFANERSATEFVSRCEPLADQFLVDTGQVAVNLLSGSDERCWLYIEDGQVVWQGPGDLNLIAEHILR